MSGEAMGPGKRKRDNRNLVFISLLELCLTYWKMAVPFVPCEHFRKGRGNDAEYDFWCTGDNELRV